MQKPVKTGKYTEINKQSVVKFGLIEKNMELSHIHEAVLFLQFEMILTSPQW